MNKMLYYDVERDQEQVTETSIQQIVYVQQKLFYCFKWPNIKICTFGPTEAFSLLSKCFFKLLK